MTTVAIAGFTALDTAAQDQYFWDSKTSAPFGSAPNAGIQREFYARLRLSIPASSSRTLSVEGISVIGPTVAGHGNTVDVRVGAAGTEPIFFKCLTFTTVGVKDTQSVTLPAGDLTVEIIDHLGGQDGASGGTAGGITGINTTGSIQLPTTPPQRTLYILGASGSYAYFGYDPAHVVSGQLIFELSWQGLIRSSRRFDQVYTRLHNGFGITGYGITDASSAAAYVAANIVPRCDGTLEQVVYLELAAGDMEGNSSTPTTFATKLGFLVDAVHSAVPSATVYIQSPIVYNGPSPNASGYVMTDYNAVFPGIVATRPWLHLIDGLQMGRSGHNEDLSDGLHLIPQRQSPSAAYIGSQLGGTFRDIELRRNLANVSATYPIKGCGSGSGVQLQQATWDGSSATPVGWTT